MAPRILIVGGTGQIGQAVVRDLHVHTSATLVLGSRNRARGEEVAATFGTRGEYVAVDLDTASVDELQILVRGMDLVMQCVGPFRERPPTLMEASIRAGVNYVDVCDDKKATQQRLALDSMARAAGVTALIDTGTFPGIDNVLVADALRRRPQADDVRLHFVCAGSGGGGFGVLQTTFIAVSQPYEQLVDGVWQRTPSYRQRQVVDFGPPMGNRPVYNFEVPELWSLAYAFPQLKRCTSQFGSIPEIWNWSTMALAMSPARYRSDRVFLDRAAEWSLPKVHRIDQRVGAALGIRIEVRAPDGSNEVILFYAPSTVEAVGWATGIAAAMVLDGEISEAGVLLPETHIPPRLYAQRLVARGGVIRRRLG